MTIVELDPPQQLAFQRPFAEGATSTLRVRNVTDTTIAFKVKTTAPKQYCVRPNCGNIGPRETIEVSVLLQPMKVDPPPGFKCKDKFLVQSVKIASMEVDIASADLWPIIEKSRKDEIVEHKLRCAYLDASGNEGSGDSGGSDPLRVTLPGDSPAGGSMVGNDDDGNNSAMWSAAPKSPMMSAVPSRSDMSAATHTLQRAAAGTEEPPAPPAYTPPLPVAAPPAPVPAVPAPISAAPAVVPAAPVTLPMAAIPNPAASGNNGSTSMPSLAGSATFQSTSRDIPAAAPAPAAPVARAPVAPALPTPLPLAASHAPSRPAETVISMEKTLAANVKTLEARIATLEDATAQKERKIAELTQQLQQANATAATLRQRSVPAPIAAAAPTSAAASAAPAQPQVITRTIVNPSYYPPQLVFIVAVVSFLLGAIVF
ncbi:phosphatidylinositol-binding protein scs2 [Blastocladiella emersonii ATCC 22665]|nr:phosphatidylinositol-binding protein scs2 [Blastocladiella emersonii ATCC 22665]